MNRFTPTRVQVKHASSVAGRVASSAAPARVGRQAGIGAGRRLGSNANNPSTRDLTPEQRQSRRHGRRRDKFWLRYLLRRLSALKRVRHCGYAMAGGNDGAGPALAISETEHGNVAGLTGLQHCGSVWACPVCAASIANRRAQELATVMRHALEQGCSASMVTLTMRHFEGQSLKQCWDALSYAWGAVTTGRVWTADQKSAKLHGWVKAVEVTHGENGWHVHVHALMIWKTKITETEAKRFGDRMWLRWSRALARKGFDSLRDSGGLDVRRASLRTDGKGATGGLHEYFVKLAHEVTGGQAKLAKGSGRTPFQILADVFEQGLADDVDLWHEWEKASRGRRQMNWSNGLREWAQVEEKSDQEIVDEELEGPELLALEPDSWRELRNSPDDVCDLYEAAERGGFDAAVQVLDRQGLAWIRGRAAPPYPPPSDGYKQLNRPQVAEMRELVVRMNRQQERSGLELVGDRV